MGRTVALLLSVAVLTGCGGGETPVAPSDTPAPTTEAPDPVEAAPATTEPPAPLAPEKEEPDEEDTLLVFGMVNAPSGASLGPLEGDTACMGMRAYRDAKEGVQVTIYGASNNIVALAELGPAQWYEEYEECVWMYQSPDVPTGEGFYSAEIAGFGSSSVVPEEDVANYEYKGFLILPD